MLTWLNENLGTIIITLVLIAIVSVIIARMIKNSKQGGASCGCGCEHCAMKGRCHK